MRIFITNCAVIILLILSACDQCGPDVSLGEYRLLEESKADWYPYIGVDILTFENKDGEAIDLTMNHRREEMLDQRYRDICKGRNIEDVTRELYSSERILVEYSVVRENITYFLTATIYVDRFAPDGASELAVYDRVSYASRIQNFNDPNNIMIEGDISLVADSRGTPVVNTDLWYNTIAHFADEIEINDKTYQDVWYFESAGKTTLYVQEGRGIIAFLGFDDKVWVLK